MDCKITSTNIGKVSPPSESPIENVNGILRFFCPHCDGKIEVEIGQLNCRIFRHAYYKNSYRQIPPHAPKAQCDKLVAGNKVYGCAKPFRINGNPGGGFVAVKCGYI